MTDRELNVVLEDADADASGESPPSGLDLPISFIKASRLMSISKKALVRLIKKGKLELHPPEWQTKYLEAEELPKKSLICYLLKRRITCPDCTEFKACEACMVKEAKKTPCHCCGESPVYREGFCTNDPSDRTDYEVDQHEKEVNAVFISRAKRRWPEAVKALQEILKLSNPRNVVNGDDTPFELLREIYQIAQRVGY